MKKILGITVGGLQRKTVTLVLMVLFVTIGIFSVVAAYQNRLLVKLVEETKREQQDSPKYRSFCRRALLPRR